MHGNLQETLSENYSQNGPENLPENTAYHHNYYEIQSASNRPPSEQQNYNIQLQAIHQKGQKTYNLRLPVPHKENDQLQRSMTRQGRRSRVIMDINQNQNVPQTPIKQKSNKVLKLFDLQNQGGQVQDVVVEKTKDFQGNIQVNTLPIEVNGYKQKRQTNKQGDQKLKGKAVAIQKGGETVVKKDELFQKKMLKEPKHNTQQIKQTQQNIKDEAKYQEQILQSSVKRSRLFEVAKDKETGLQKNILFQSKNNDDDYIVSPQYNSRSSLDTGLQITTSRDQFSSRQIIQNKSLVVPQKGSRKRLPALQPLNSVLKNNEKKLYQLKNYEKLEQKHKISKRLKNGNYCIHNDQIQDVYNFIRGKIPHHRTLESTIVRNKECRKLWFLDYDFNTNQGKYLLSCKKMPFHFFSTYNISLLKNQFKDGSQYLIGRIEANFTGSIFNIYTPKEENNKQMQISATIYYSPDFTCCKVNARQIEVYLKNESYLFQDLEGVNEKNKNLKELYEIESNRERKKISKFVNKKAVWREYLQTFVLNFRGKSKVPSVKNMILESDDDRKQEALLLAKSQTNQFQLDISYPFSPLIGFAVAITSFDFKLATQ